MPIESTEELQDALLELLESVAALDAGDRDEIPTIDDETLEPFEGVDVETYRSAGVLTRDQGLVLRFDDAYFQITIVRSR